MAQPRPVVRKTKKSSYKPMSKLNEDSLTDLRRLEKPEYSNQVFFYNTATRTKLRTSVNVWFRDHQTVMTNIGRKQQAVYKIMCRVKNEQRRVQREVYKRKQAELRKDIQRRQLELMQRRVVRQFRKNAANKMASRGLTSICATRLEAAFNPSSLGFGEVMEKIARATSNLSAKSEDEVKELTRRGSTDSETSSSILEESNAGAAKTVRRHSLTQVGSSKSVSEDKLHTTNQAPQTAEAKNVDKHASETKSQTLSSSEADAPKLSGTQTSRKRSSMVSVPPELKAIPEIVSPCPSVQEEGKTSDRKDSVQSNTGTTSPTKDSTYSSQPHASSTQMSGECNADKRVIPNVPPSHTEAKPRDALQRSSSKVVEVRKGRPHSPATKTLVSSPATEEHHPVRNVHDHHDNSHVYREKSPQKVVDHKDHSHDLQTKGRSHDLHAKSHHALSRRDDSRKASYDSQVSNASSKHSEKMERTRKNVCFGNAPSREKVMEDAMAFLSSAEGSRSSSGSRSKRAGKIGLAAKIRLERKNEARKRAELLDSEPLVQYYRSVRGTLQPLLTKPNRRVFTPPSNRARYQQVKLLREEHLKEVVRKQDIDKFFKDVFSHEETGTEAQKQAQEESKPKGTGNGSNLLAAMIQRMRQDASGGTQSNRNSLEQLSKCQYLRVYHVGDHEKGQRLVQEHKVTSWDAAENSLKAGFLALDFSRM